jgi:beta-galactosidase/beta-glucuronidase
MRIDLEDCDMPFPSASDVTEDLDAIPQHLKERCILYSSHVVGELWSKLVRLSILLGRILKLHSKNVWRTDAEELEKYETELQEYTALATHGQPSNPYEQFFACQVRIHHE